MTLPLVSVVVPCLDQERFLAAAVDSILDQDYPRLEVLVMDGGSSDRSAAILASYGDRIAFISARDGGQSAAINRGFGRVSGEIVAWLNADDRYLPGAVRRAVAALTERPDAGMVYGYGELIDEHGDALGPFYANRPFDLWSLLRVSDFIMQPAAFLRASCVAAVGGLDEGLHYGMDWDLWLKLACRWPVVCVPHLLAQTREHAGTKTARGGLRRFRELRAILRRHGARGWPPAAVAYGLDTLRKLHPAVFGPGSRAQARAQCGAVLPRLFRPLHHVLAAVIDHRLVHGQGLYPGGWAARRACAAVAWGGQPGCVVVRGDLPADVARRPWRLEVRAAGSCASTVRDRPGTFAVSVPVAREPGPPRALEVVMRASHACRRPEQARRIAFRLLELGFRAGRETEAGEREQTLPLPPRLE